MRFIADGPSIPDDLLMARDHGDVIFFCGAGVSQAYAKLPSFACLAHQVIHNLGAAQNSRARQLLDNAINIRKMMGPGGSLAADRIFGLLEREFEVSDVRAAVAEALRPPEDCNLDAHRILLDLATTSGGITRLVTTNFDLLFEKCHPTLDSFCPPRLPDPQSNREFRGIVHLHGSVEPKYQSPRDGEFIVSSADFGRAYLSDGWATRFIQSLLARFQIVFVGYSADDPPVQYLLEALNLRAGSRKRLFAFQEDDSDEAAALWDQRGVHSILFNESHDFGPLWNTLSAWASRARNIDNWYTEILSTAQPGPAALDPHIRGQIAHVISTRKGTNRIAKAEAPIDASWLLTFDSRCRYGAPYHADIYDDESEREDPFKFLGLDFDILPDPITPENRYQNRQIPESAWDLFISTRLDHEDSGENAIGAVRGFAADLAAALPPRLASIGIWIQSVAHMPLTLWWAAQQSTLHPSIREGIARQLLQKPELFSKKIRRGWHLLLTKWDEKRSDPDSQSYQIQTHTAQEGWSQSLVRELANIYRPHLIVEIPFNIKHPFSWVAEGITDDIIRAVIEYPHPHLKVEIPDSHVSYAVSQFRGNLELAISLENEISGNDYLHFETTRAPDGGPELPDDSYGLAGPIIMFQKLMERWMHIDLPAARIEINRWPGSDQHLFARLRIWAAGHPLLCADQSAEIFLSLTDRVFWFSLHERDLLYAIRDRWRDLPSDARSALEIRLRTGSYPWNEDVQGSVEQKAAYHRLSRLHWLSGQGVVFSFDLSAEMERLHEIEPEWTETAGNTVADSHSSAAYSIAIDDNADALLNTPISEILPKAQEIGTRDFFDRAQREPFLGLSKRHPSRALAALTHAGRNNVGQSSAWSTFLHVDTRPDDRVRMIQVIAMRLIRLPVGQFEIIIYSISEWMKSIAMRLYGDANSILGPLWDRMIIILSMSTGDGYRKSERSWIEGALNAPVGKLINLLMKDPAINDLPNSFGLPTHWTARADQLLNLPGDLRCQALVMLGHQLAWLYFIDPIWTTKSLLPAAEDRGDDGTAFWEGVLRVVRWPTPELFQCLKTELFYRARRNSNRQKHSNSIAFLLFGGWLNGTHLGQEKLVSDSEFREILIHADDELRRNCIWQLTQFLKDKKYRIQIMSFLMDVWPKQRALRTPSISAKLTEFALESGDLMPRVVELILPRLMPATFEIMFLKKEAPDHPARQYPKTTLDLLWVVLAEDPRQWPYLIEDVLQLLSEAPETSNDSRLSELKRRRDRLI